MNDKENKFCLTMKGIALMKLVEAGVIRREEDGNVNTDGFETFWDSFERNLYTAMDNAMEELSRSYQSSEKTAGPTTALERESFMVKSLSSRRWRWYWASSWRFCW